MQEDFSIKEIYEVIPRSIIKSICNNYKLDLIKGQNALYHWTRVIENGLIIGEYNKANKKVIIAFSFFHKSRRVNEEYDQDENLKGVELLKYYSEELNMTEAEINLTIQACLGFQTETESEDKTIQTCWDAEKLDSMRLGIYPDKNKLGTEYAKNAGIITWATKRGMAGKVSDWVYDLIDDINLQN